MLKVIVKKDSKYRVLYDTPKHIRYILLYGGRATGRSFQGSRSEVINLLTKPYYRGFLVRNVLDTVRDSIFRDCLDRIEELGISQITAIESKLTLKYNQNQLKGRGFRKSSGSDTAKNKSVAGINRIIIEEAEETDKEDFDQMDLSLRTTKGQVVIVLLFNPPIKGHWILKEWFNLVPATKINAHKYFKRCWYEDVEDKCLDGFFLPTPKPERKESHYIFGTYHENIKNLDQNTINKMERYKETDIDYYLHKVCGLVPSGKTGRVFKQYSIIPTKEYNELAYSPRYGLDFGFNHPSAAVEIKVHNENLYIDEILYETGLTNPNIADRLSWITTKITADSAEPKSIEELNRLGLYVEPSRKGQDSVINGIQKMKQYKIFVTDGSKNLLNEFENYTWKLDKNKEPTDIPEDGWNHAIDAVRYALEGVGEPEVNLDETFILC